jgi:2-polyprenyl-3-methyl-5-hydroxy-6-metoxy-1,4-benzoquinol methylase
MLQSVPCNLCGEERFELRYNIQKCNRQIVKCTKCGLLYVNPQNPQNLTYDYEDKGERQGKYQEAQDLATKRHDHCYEEVYTKEEEWRVLHFADRANKVRKFCSSGRLLDIGCARGLFLSNFLTTEDFDIYGIEPRDWICARAVKRLGNKVFCGTLKEANLPDTQYDVVTMINLIEHLPSPKNTLLEVNRVMKPGALLMIETPNVEGLLTRIMGNRWHTFLESEHNFFFSKTTISNLLSKTGFKTLSIEPAYKFFTLRYLFYQAAWYNKALSRLLVRLVESLGLSDKQIKLRQPGEMIVFARKS